MQNNYQEWKSELISIIKTEANLQENQIALPRDLEQYFLDGITPQELFFNVWKQDAGNYYAI